MSRLHPVRTELVSNAWQYGLMTMLALSAPHATLAADAGDMASPALFHGDQEVSDVLAAATRFYGAQRSGDGANWLLDPGVTCYMRDGEAIGINLSGGWFDAGDTNKYVTFATEPVHGLLAVQRRHPTLFDDDLGIPETGNGIPDIVDEVKWETDWLEKMQLDDGSVLIKVGHVEFEHELIPSQEFRPRFYEEPCSSATIATAGMFAHAAIVFSSFPALAEDAARLEDRAEAAWRWYQANPKRDDCDALEVKAGDADWPVEIQAQYEVVAAVYLFALTGERRYLDVVVGGLELTQPFQGDGFGHYFPDQADALLFYRDLPDADADVRQRIDDRVAELVGSSPLLGFSPADDLYRSYLPDPSYHWGSSRVRANAGASNLLLDPVPGGPERALGHLHYFHGVNPLGLVYLSNMSSLGAERSVQHLFHYWFGDGTVFDVNRNEEIGVAPGYLVGGPNHSYGGIDAAMAGQPPQKAYVDESGDELAQAWELTEPAIYYQSSYLRLLAAVLDHQG